MIKTHGRTFTNSISPDCHAKPLCAMPSVENDLAWPWDGISYAGAGLRVNEMFRIVSLWQADLLHW